MRVCALKGTNSASNAARLAPAQAHTSPWPAPRSSGPRASRRRGSPAAPRRPAGARSPRRGDELRRPAVAEGDGAGLVEQQRVHVARRFDRAAAHGQHVVAAPAGPCRRCRSPKAGRRSSSESGRPAARPARSRLRRPNTWRSGCSVTTASRKIMVRPESRISARSRWASSAARRLRPARSCGRETSRRGSR
jgi:hypothetical protein